MYVYVYDELAIKNEGFLHKIEKRLTDLGLNGQTIKPGVSKSVKLSVEDKIKQGARTIVAVGSDKGISQVMNIIANSQNDNKQNVTLGIIPAEKKNESLFAKAFGIGNIDDACNIILARRLKTFIPAKINENCFFFNADISNSESTVLEIDKKYTIQSESSIDIRISNQPTKNKLKIFLKNKKGESFFDAQSVLVVSKNDQIITDGSFKTPPPAILTPGNETIKVIVGKNRGI